MSERPKVLLAEDDQSIVTVITAALDAENVDVDSCDSVARRDAILAEDRHDLLITDVMLADSDGIDTLMQLKQDHPDMPVIIISAQNTLDTAVRASEAGAFEYLPKPFDLDELVLAVQQGLRQANRGGMPVEQIGDSSLPLVGRSAAMQDVYRMVARLLKNDLSVLILGESGTGKELVAEAIHNLGHRKTGPFIAVNMAAIPAELIEAELFGHEKGAFTGAVGQSIGKFEQAQGGTLFLDEIGDMPMQAQTRLLRALQTGSITRVGGKANIKLDVRIITATNKDFDAMIAEGKFREDLYYRINVMPIQLPPLRERIEDVEALAKHFLALAAKEGLPSKQINSEAIDQLRMHRWRGNVRELKNVMYRLAVTTREDVIGPEAVLSQRDDPQSSSPSGKGESRSMASAVIQLITASRHNRQIDGKLYEHVLAAMEKPLLEEVMKRTRGNQLRAASMLGINRNTLRKKLQEREVKPSRD